MVASIELEFIEELKNEYTGYTNKTPKLFLAHLAKEYCAATIDDKLSAVQEFEQPWDQVVKMSAWITRLELLRRKCTEAGVVIDAARMVLTISSNAMKCPLFTQLDHKKLRQSHAQISCRCQGVLGEKLQSPQEVQSRSSCYQ